MAGAVGWEALPGPRRPRPGHPCGLGTRQAAPGLSLSHPGKQSCCPRAQSWLWAAAPSRPPLPLQCPSLPLTVSKWHPSHQVHLPQEAALQPPFPGRHFWAWALSPCAASHGAAASLRGSITPRQPPPRWDIGRKSSNTRFPWSDYWSGLVFWETLNSFFAAGLSEPLILLTGILNLPHGGRVKLPVSALIYSLNPGDFSEQSLRNATRSHLLRTAWQSRGHTGRHWALPSLGGVGTSGEFSLRATPDIAQATEPSHLPLGEVTDDHPGRV